MHLFGLKSIKTVIPLKKMIQNPAFWCYRNYARKTTLKKRIIVHLRIVKGGINCSMFLKYPIEYMLSIIDESCKNNHVYVIHRAGENMDLLVKMFQIHNSFYTDTISFRHMAHCSVWRLSTLFLKQKKVVSSV